MLSSYDSLDRDLREEDWQDVQRAFTNLEAEEKKLQTRLDEIQDEKAYLVEEAKGLGKELS